MSHTVSLCTENVTVKANVSEPQGILHSAGFPCVLGAQDVPAASVSLLGREHTTLTSVVENSTALSVFDNHVTNHVTVFLNFLLSFVICSGNILTVMAICRTHKLQVRISA